MNMTQIFSNSALCQRTPGRRVSFRLAPFRLAPFRLAPFRLAPFRLAPFRLAPFRLVALLWGVLPLVASGCFYDLDRGDAFGEGEVIGIVVDEDGTAAAFAKLTLAGAPRTVHAKSDGTFKMSGLTAGSHRLRVVVDVDGNGFASLGTVAAFTLPEDSGIDLGTIVVRPTTTLSGRVERENGALVPGARVFVFREFEANDQVFDSAVEAEVVTDRDGAFVVPGVVDGALRIFAASDTVGDAVTFAGTDTPVVLTIPNENEPSSERTVRLIVSPVFDDTAQVFIFDYQTQTVLERNAVFAAGETDLEALSPGRYDVRVCMRGGACSSTSIDDATAYSMPLPGDGAQYRWGPLFFSPCTDCDEDGTERFAIPITPAAHTACDVTCLNVYDDPTATCAFGGQVLDCDDDGDGQSDLHEPEDCLFVGAGGDRDDDGICDRNDPYPDCPSNIETECLTPGAFPPGDGDLPGLGPDVVGPLDECAADLDNCANNAVCTDLEEGFLCECDDGFIGDGVTCDDVNECATSNACGAEGTCVNNVGSFSCDCRAGFVVDEDRTDDICQDIDECAGVNPCGAGTCANDVGSFTCTCETGYVANAELTEDVCQDIDECADDLDNCGADATCTSIVGSFTCACNEGFTGDGVTCDDVDECVELLANCDANAACLNAAGTFSCLCIPGYDGDGVTCADIDECTADSDDCSDDATCTNNVGSFSCACNTGFSGDGVTCVDVDECLTNVDNCNTNATCANVTGGFSCTCNSGFAGDGVTCTDVDECGTAADTCGINGTCNNIGGGFTCSCNTGYEDVNLVCVDVDECAQNPCDTLAFSECVNTPGSFQCDCENGYVLENGSCVIAVDHCVPIEICGPGSCINEVNGYDCLCEVGFTFDGTECVDILECQDPNICGPGTCVEQFGSYSCTCDEGYAFDGTTCLISDVVAACTSSAQREGGTYGQQAAFTDIDGNTGTVAGGDRLGRAVAMADTGVTMITGAPNDVEPQQGTSPGSTHIFTNTGSWGFNDFIFPPSASDLDDVGFSVAIDESGTTIVIGAPANDLNGTSAGTVWIYTRNAFNGFWEETAQFVPQIANAGDNFGAAVAIRSNVSPPIIAVGAPGVSTNTGAVYLFTHDGSLWNETQILTSTSTSAEKFGESIAFNSNGGFLIVGAKNHSDIATNAGAAYVFAKFGLNFVQQGQLLAPDGAAGDQFGRSVSLTTNGATALVGAPGDIDGSAYLFDRVSGSWGYVQKVRPRTVIAGGAFGTASALGQSSVMFVGAPAPGGTSTPAAYVYLIEAGRMCEYEILSSGTGATDDDFGFSISTAPDGNDMVVGARFGNGGATNGKGEVFIYRYFQP